MLICPEDFNVDGYHEKKLEVMRPRCISLLNHLRIYAPQLFPDLNKIIFLDDDVVVQHDLSALWQVNLNGKVVGAVFDSGCGLDCCPGRKYKNYFNFSNSFIISSHLNEDQCGWLYGMNVFNLDAWRNTNITATYNHWLKFNLESGLDLWNPGALPPALLAFSDRVDPIHPSWHVAGLGYRFHQVDLDTLKAAAVLHFSGPAKPWLEIGDPEKLYHGKFTPSQFFKQFSYLHPNPPPLVFFKKFQFLIKNSPEAFDKIM